MRPGVRATRSCSASLPASHAASACTAGFSTPRCSTAAAVGKTSVPNPALVRVDHLEGGDAHRAGRRLLRSGQPEGRLPGGEERLHSGSVLGHLRALGGDGPQEPQGRLVAREHRQGGEGGRPLPAVRRGDGLEAGQPRVGEVAQAARLHRECDPGSTSRTRARAPTGKKRRADPSTVRPRRGCRGRAGNEAAATGAAPGPGRRTRPGRPGPGPRRAPRGPVVDSLTSVTSARAATGETEAWTFTSGSGAPAEQAAAPVAHARQSSAAARERTVSRPARASRSARRGRARTARSPPFDWAATRASAAPRTSAAKDMVPSPSKLATPTLAVRPPGWARARFTSRSAAVRAPSASVWGMKTRMRSAS